MRTVSLLAFLIVMGSCKKKEPEMHEPARWPPETTDHYLPQEYTTWFDSIPWKETRFPAQAEGDISDSFTIEKDASQDCDFFLKECNEYRRTQYFSDLYGYYFDCRIFQSRDTTILQLHSGGYDWVLEYSLSSNEPRRSYIMYSDTKGANTSLTVHDTMDIAGRRFENIYEIKNPNELDEKEIRSIRSFFLDKHYGVVRVELANGLIWDITGWKK